MKLVEEKLEKCFKTLELTGNSRKDHKSTRNKSKNKMGFHYTKVSAQYRKPQSAETA